MHPPRNPHDRAPSRSRRQTAAAAVTKLRAVFAKVLERIPRFAEANAVLEDRTVLAPLALGQRASVAVRYVIDDTEYEATVEWGYHDRARARPVRNLTIRMSNDGFRYAGVGGETW